MISKIDYNKKVHDKVAKKYKKNHTEIYNDIEQKRLSEEISKIASLLNTKDQDRVALDFGCGDGNLTQYLVQNNFSKIISADISEKFLSIIQAKFPRVSTLILNGEDLKGLEDSSVDFICTYSVLHHVPDYIKIVEEFCRILKPGGILMIDHEVSGKYWEERDKLLKFYKEATPFWVRIRKYLRLSNYINKLKSFKDPRYSAEGDIHVFADDHIEWSKIIEILKKENFCEIEQKEYLLYRGGYRKNIYDSYSKSLVDMNLLVARK